MPEEGRTRKLKIFIIFIIVIIVVILGVYIYFILSLNPYDPELDFTFETVENQPHPDIVLDELDHAPVFIEFTQNDENCPPCARLRPKVEELEEEFSDNVVFLIINVNTNEITKYYKGSKHVELISDSEESDIYSVYDLQNIAAGHVATPTFIIITKDKDDDGKTKPSFGVGYGEFKDEDTEKTKDALANDLKYAIKEYELNK